MGYSNVLEVFSKGKITATTTSFPSSGPPKITVTGEGQANTKALAERKTICCLSYARTLLSFEAQISKTSQQPQQNAYLKVPTRSIRCLAECIGLPEIKSGVSVTLDSLGKRLNGDYFVERAVHSFDGVFGFRTKFEALSIG